MAIVENPVPSEEERLRRPTQMQLFLSHLTFEIAVPFMAAFIGGLFLFGLFVAHVSNTELANERAKWNAEMQLLNATCHVNSNVDTTSTFNVNYHPQQQPSSSSPPPTSSPAVNFAVPMPMPVRADIRTNVTHLNLLEQMSLEDFVVWVKPNVEWYFVDIGHEAPYEWNSKALRLYSYFHGGATMPELCEKLVYPRQSSSTGVGDVEEGHLRIRCMNAITLAINSATLCVILTICTILVLISTIYCCHTQTKRH